MSGRNQLQDFQQLPNNALVIADHPAAKVPGCIVENCGRSVYLDVDALYCKFHHDAAWYRDVVTPRYHADVLRQASGHAKISRMQSVGCSTYRPMIAMPDSPRK